MINYILQIEVRRGCLPEAIETLSTIERESQADAGLVAFVWLQDAADPHRFTLFEQWENQRALDAHLAKDPSVWERFVPCLAGEPRSYPMRLVRELAAAPGEAEVRDFAVTWFDRLSERAPVEELLAMVTDAGLHMEFPEAMLTDEAEFRAWYAEVGRLFRAQSHVVEQLEVRPIDGTRAADVEVTVIWRARQIPGGAPLEFRARQSWRVERSLETGRPVIVTYQVRTLEDLAQAA
jgi:quinol monooxygenase YgiN